MMYDLSNQSDVFNLRNRMNHLYKKGACVEVNEKLIQRTLKQNSYLHTIIAYFASIAGVTKEEAKQRFYKGAANRELYYIRTRNVFGVMVEDYRSSTELSPEEMSLSIDRFKNWSVQVAGIILPDADNKDGMMAAYKEIEKAKAYI